MRVPKRAKLHRCDHESDQTPDGQVPPTPGTWRCCLVTTVIKRPSLQELELLYTPFEPDQHTDVHKCQHTCCRIAYAAALWYSRQEVSGLATARDS